MDQLQPSIEQSDAHKIGKSLDSVMMLLEAADMHRGVPAETRHCLDQLAAEVRLLVASYQRLVGSPDMAQVEGSPHQRPSGPTRDPLHLADLGLCINKAAGLRLLTRQEVHILRLLGVGRTNRQIADELFLAEKTVKNYVSNLLHKLGMERRTQAAVYAARLGSALDRSDLADGPLRQRKDCLASSA